MARKRNQIEEDEPEGAPEWMVTFSDCMTLLLTFFVLLLSFASFTAEDLQRLKGISATAQASVGVDKRKIEAMSEDQEVVRVQNMNEGSERQTLLTKSKTGVPEQVEPVDFRSQKVFLNDSSSIFFARGIVFSPTGEKILYTLASFLKKVPGKIVISENGPNAGGGGRYLGLPRAIAVMEYLTKCGVDKSRFSVSSVSTLRYGNNAARELEIVILERRISN